MISKEAQEALDVIRRDLRVRVNVRHLQGNFYRSSGIEVEVILKIGDEILSQDSDCISLSND